MDKSFYNTISLKGDALKEARANAAFQETVITAIFKDNPGIRLSPSMVLDIFTNHLQKNVPMTSIRRGITNLTKGDKEKGIEGILRKTEETRIGLYGLPEHLWELKSENGKFHGEPFYKKGVETAADIASKMLSNSMEQKKLFGE